MDSGICLYLDENLEVEIAVQMRSRGFRAVTVRDLGLLGDTDENHLMNATKMGCVLCTYDTDYLRLHEQGVSHAGIVFAHQNRVTLGDWVKWLDLLCRVYTPNDMKNHVEYL